MLRQAAAQLAAALHRGVVQQAGRASCVDPLQSLRSFAASAHTLVQPAFVLDIDGVLVRGKQVLPAARRALARLYSPDGITPRYPLAFLTNGGGSLEAVKAAQLSEWLDFPVSAHQVVLSHTPFRWLVPPLGRHPVLVLGRGQVPQVAAAYGFRNVITTQQLQAAMPESTPFCQPGGALSDVEGGSGPCPIRDGGAGSAANPIRAILVFNDPSDWYRDLQLATDILVGGGVLGARRPPPGSPRVQVYFSNPDLLWANEHPVPRFGQGAFAVALEAVVQQTTGKPLDPKCFFGKPHPQPYRLIERLLLAQLGQGTHTDVFASPLLDAAGLAADPLPFPAIYAVGDNPAADVRGANSAGHPWVSVLVRTGVWAGKHNCSIDPAALVVSDVDEAVQAALHRERAAKWHSLR